VVKDQWLPAPREKKKQNFTIQSTGDPPQPTREIAKIKSTGASYKTLAASGKFQKV